jgi:hypothetical protein
MEISKVNEFEVSVFKSGVPVLMAKHAELSLGIMYSAYC